MNKGSKLTTKYPELRKEVIRLLGLHRIAFDQERVFEKVVSLFQAEIFSFGRKTVTGLLMTLGGVEEDWSRWYRLFTTDQFNEERVNRELFPQQVVHQLKSFLFVSQNLCVRVSHMAAFCWIPLICINKHN